MYYDVSNVFLHLGLDHQPSQLYYQPQQYQQPEQEDNDEEEDLDEEEQDSDEEDWASSKLGGGSYRQVSHHIPTVFSAAMP